MEWQIVITNHFDRKFKPLNKKYKSLKSDFIEFVKKLKLNPYQGSDLGAGIRKIRMAISSKEKGKVEGQG